MSLIIGLSIPWILTDRVETPAHVCKLQLSQQAPGHARCHQICASPACATCNRQHLLLRDSQHDVLVLLQLPIGSPADVGDLVQPPRQLQALVGADDELAAPLELQLVLQVPGDARVQDL